MPPRMARSTRQIQFAGISKPVLHRRKRNGVTGMTQVKQSTLVQNVAPAFLDRSAKKFTWRKPRCVCCAFHQQICSTCPPGYEVCHTATEIIEKRLSLCCNSSASEQPHVFSIPADWFGLQHAFIITTLSSTHIPP
jgi:hypothetical protein